MNKTINEMLQNAKGFLNVLGDNDDPAPDVKSALREINEALAAMGAIRKKLQTLNEVSEDAFNDF